MLERMVAGMFGAGVDTATGGTSTSFSGTMSPSFTRVCSMRLSSSAFLRSSSSFFRRACSSCFLRFPLPAAAGRPSSCFRRSSSSFFRRAWSSCFLAPFVQELLLLLLGLDLFQVLFLLQLGFVEQLLGGRRARSAALLHGRRLGRGRAGAARLVPAARRGLLLTAGLRSAGTTGGGRLVDHEEIEAGADGADAARRPPAAARGNFFFSRSSSLKMDSGLKAGFFSRGRFFRRAAEPCLRRN